MLGRRLACLVIPVSAAALALSACPVEAATSTPNDPYFTHGDQWGLTGATASINAPAAWCASTGAGILVADVDTGADFAHPDLAGKLVAGARFTSGTGSETQGGVSDDFGHGSMTTGLITANTNNGVGIAGVAPDSRVLVVKVLTSNGNGSATGSEVDVAAGIRYAADHGARVINLSIGPEIPLTGTSTTSGIPDAINYAALKGALVAVAAGNSSLPAASYTGIQGVALVVGALGPSGLPAYYSNSLAGVNLYAPGGNDLEGNDAQHLILSTNRFGTISGAGGYDLEEGTSFAAPHAAGVAALLMAHGMSAQAAHDRIIATAASRNGLAELDAAAALGVSPTLRCAPSSGGSTGATQGGGGSAPGSSGGGAGGHGGTSGTQGASGAPAAGSPGAAAAAAAAASGTPGPTGRVGTGGGGSSAVGGIPQTPAAPPVPALVGLAALLLAGAASVAVLVRRRLLH